MTDDLMSTHFTERPIEDRLVRAALAAQTLSETLWEALHEELAGRSEIGRRGQRIAELSERLGEVAAAVTSLARADPRVNARPDARPRDTRPRSSAAMPPGAVDDAPDAAPEPPDAPVERGFRVARVTSEHEQPYPSPPREPVPPRETFSRRESYATDEPLSAAVLIDELAPHARQEIEIKDERREEPHREQTRGEDGPDAWVGAIGRALARYEQDGLGFAVLLVELADVERLRHAEPPGEVSRLTGLVEAALTGELRPADSLTRESPGRYWLLTPEADSNGARMLAERLVSAVRDAGSHRGVPLQIAVGIAVCPGDGSQAAALAAHADIALYGARASGRPLAP